MKTESSIERITNRLPVCTGCAFPEIVSAGKNKFDIGTFNRREALSTNWIPVCRCNTELPWIPLCISEKRVSRSSKLYCFRLLHYCVSRSSVNRVLFIGAQIGTSDWKLNFLALRLTSLLSSLHWCPCSGV